MDRGFTLAEVLISTTLTGLIAAAVFLLLDTGLRSHETGQENLLSVSALAPALLAMRGEIARSQTVVFAAADSMVLAQPSGEQIAYVGRDRTEGVDVYRLRWSSGSWIEQPRRPLASLHDHGTDPASLGFSMVSGGVDVGIVTGGRQFSFHSNPWVGR